MPMRAPGQEDGGSGQERQPDVCGVGSVLVARRGLFDDGVSLDAVVGCSPLVEDGGVGVGGAEGEDGSVGHGSGSGG